MKWNIEWADLKNIEYMVADCWRMSERQIEHYCRELIQQRDFVFASELGMKFLEFICRKMDSDTKIDWSKIQKDIRQMQDIIKEGQGWDEHGWNRQYHALKADPSAYFYTELGDAFTAQLAEKLELNLSEDQKRLYHDVRAIQQICTTCCWENHSEAQKALSYLLKKDKNVFLSWLGDGFVQILLERFEMKKKEPEIEVENEINQEMRFDPANAVSHTGAQAGVKTGRKIKKACILILGITISFFCGYLFSKVQEGQIRLDLQDLSARIPILTAGSTGQTDHQPEHTVIDQETESVHQADTFYESTSLIKNQDDDANKNNENSDQDDGGADSKDTESRTEQANEQNESMNEDGLYADHTADEYHTGQTGSLDTLDEHTADTGTASNSEAAVLPEILPQYTKFHQKYPDLFGWLNIPGTEIDYPVMQSDDGKMGERYYYLHRDYTGKKAEQGSLFVESTSSCFPQDDNTVIYGHNMSNGHYFGMLAKYRDKNFFNSHQKIQYDTIYETGTYQVAAVLLTRVLYQEEQGFRYYRFYNYHTDSEFQECVDFVKENQLYDTGIKLAYGDQLLMLSTCEYSKENGRLVIVAKKTE